MNWNPIHFINTFFFSLFPLTLSLSLSLALTLVGSPALLYCVFFQQFNIKKKIYIKKKEEKIPKWEGEERLRGGKRGGKLLLLLMLLFRDHSAVIWQRGCQHIDHSHTDAFFAFSTLGCFVRLYTTLWSICLPRSDHYIHHKKKQQQLVFAQLVSYNRWFNRKSACHPIIYKEHWIKKWSYKLLLLGKQHLC